MTDPQQPAVPQRPFVIPRRRWTVPPVLTLLPALLFALCLLVVAVVKETKAPSSTDPHDLRYWGKLAIYWYYGLLAGGIGLWGLSAWLALRWCAPRHFGQWKAATFGIAALLALITAWSLLM